MKRGALVLLVWLICSTAMGAEARVRVATLDGAPVYHWRAFKSAIPDDVDRALILREFQRKQFRLPPKLVDDAVNGAIAKEAGGDAKKFAGQLHQEGASMDDFRLFISEEIMLNAMQFQRKGISDGEERQRKWLAGLRQGAVVKRLPASRESSR